MNKTRGRPAGFTIVELLVVIAIIGILTSLLLPAVQLARESGRRSQCSNNLKQIGLGYASYESAYQVFPPAFYSGPAPYPGQPANDNKPAVGWGIFILPYIEQKNLYDKYNFKQTFYSSAENQAIANTSIPYFECPSALHKGPYTYTFSYPGYPSITLQAVAADYSPIASVSASLAQLIWPKTPAWDPANVATDKAKLSGLLEKDKPTPPNLIKDGTSHTILVAEIAGKNDLWINGRRTEQQLSGWYGGQGGWADATSAGSILIGSSDDGTTSPGEFAINCSNDLGLYSFHRVIANAVFGDGSVRSILDQIDIHILAGMVTRAGAEIEDNP
jgi:prepilin-type N-terminal cleavage/methylation domain-containing protein